jgi:DNA-binding CsgD family transcriptional regulator
MEWHEKARALRAKGYTHAAIARQLGRSPSAVWKALNPERARAFSASDREKRREERRMTDRERARRCRGVCRECGEKMGVGHADDGVCLACLKARRRGRAERMAQLWAEGLPMREIGERVGIAWVAPEIAWWREREPGLFPHRHRGYDRGLA